tara:strand:- start:139 stop:312 length:174 start_codon:yes stop_codon:yes gene_type:complete
LVVVFLIVEVMVEVEQVVEDKVPQMEHQEDQVQVVQVLMLLVIQVLVVVEVMVFQVQ